MVVLITGANSGMGWESALQLAKLGHDLLLTVRDGGKAEALRALFPYPERLKGVYELELTDFGSISRAAGKIHKENPVIDVLLFNAGIMNPPYSKTRDGFESQFQANYLGHFYLFNLLLGCLEASSVKKVISVSSLSSEKSPIKTMDRVNEVAKCPKGAYSAMDSYRLSKLAQVLFTREVQARYGAKGLKAAAVHPGVVNTDLFYRRGSRLFRFLMQPVAWLGYLTGFIVSPRRGSRTAVWLAVNDFPGGGYWAGRKPRKANPTADNAAFCTEVWNWSLEQLPLFPET